VPQAESHKSVDSASQGGYSWPIANWEQRYATGGINSIGECHGGMRIAVGASGAVRWVGRGA